MLPLKAAHLLELGKSHLLFLTAATGTVEAMSSVA